jgi:hypothetical protein
MAKNQKSAFTRALGRELGKNTGKFVSNKVFGDGHSTPHRISIQREKTEQIKQEAKNQEKQMLSILEKEIDEKIHELSVKSIPNEEKELINFLLEIELLIKSNSWKGVGINGDEKHKLTNKYSDGLFEKYNQGVELLKLSGGNPIAIAKFESKSKVFKKKKFYGKYWFWLLFFGLFISMLLLVAIFN